MNQCQSVEVGTNITAYQKKDQYAFRIIRLIFSFKPNRYSLFKKVTKFSQKTTLFTQNERF